MKISISNITTVQGDTCYKVTDHENGAVEVVAVTSAQLVHAVLELAGVNVLHQDCSALIDLKQPN